MLPALRSALVAAQRAGGSLSVCLFDVDYFKSVNDAYGHERGDVVLRQVVERTHGLVRSEDELFRYGGDEFVLLLPRCAPDTARDLAQRVVDGIRRSPFPGSPPLSLSVSLGVASFPEDGETAEDLLRVADRRSFLAKREGRARSVHADRLDVTPTLQPVARLVERDAALTHVHRVFSEVAGRAGAALVDVAGDAGSGRTRFLAEVATVARLRGFMVLTVAGDGPPVPAGPAVADALAAADRSGSTGLCVTVDGPLDGEWRSAMADLLAGAPVGGPARPPSVVVARTVPGAAPVGEVVHDVVRLEPWTAMGLRVWLRGVLRTEPDDALVERILASSRGLPGPAEAELERLVDVGALVADPGGGWRLAEVWGAGTPRLLGRDRELATVSGLLSVRRLVTVTGPGGVGKTTLVRAVAAACAAQFPGGRHVVSLESARTRAAVEAAIAATLDVTPAPHQPLLDAVADALGVARTLLVLDNFEQVLAAAPLVSELLDTVPDLVVVATSRERLRLYGEQVLALGPLPVPDRDQLPFGGARLIEAASANAAVQLFCARAREAAWDFSLTEGNAQAVMDLCRRLDGLPLALELAAARCGQQRPQEILQSLTRAVDGLVDGPRDRADRQQTLRGAIEWSIGLLTPTEQRVFARLSVFPGTFDTDAAVAVCADEPVRPDGADPLAVRAALTALVDKSLVQLDDDRFVLLQTLREYAAELLEHGHDTDTTRHRHTTYYARLVSALSPRRAVSGQHHWLEAIHREYENYRAALTVAVEVGDFDLAAELGCGLWPYWSSRGRLDDGRALLAAVLALPREREAGLDPDARRAVWELRARLLNGAGVLATMQSDLTEAGRHLAECVEFARDHGDPLLLAAALGNLAQVYDSTADYAGARALMEESLAIRRAEGDAPGVAASVGNLGDHHKRMGELTTALALLEEALQRDRDLPSTVNLCITLANLGETLVLAGRPDAAEPMLREAYVLAGRLQDDDLLAQAEHNLGMLDGLRGDRDEAAARLRRALHLRLALREQEYAAMSLDELALLAAADGAAEPAVQLYAAAAALRSRAGTPQAPAYRRRHDPVLDGLRTATGDRFTAVWAQGTRQPPAHYADPR